MTDLSALPVGVEQVAFGCMGALLLVAGNLNPKLRNNGLMGLRTPWSRKNDRVWKKCQRFGGISLMLAGAALVLAALFTRGFLCLGLCLGVLLLMAAVDVLYSYRAAKADEALSQKKP